MKSLIIPEDNLESSGIASQMLNMRIPSKINSTNIVVEITLKTEMGDVTATSSKLQKFHNQLNFKRQFLLSSMPYRLTKLSIM